MSINQFVEMTVFLCLICFPFMTECKVSYIYETGLFIFFIFFLFFFFFCFMQKFKMATKSGRKTMPVDSAATLWVKNFIEIALSRSISEVVFFASKFEKFKMAAKSGGKTISACDYM